MPIVNGSYVPETLGDARPAQEQVFGTYSRRDMNDYSAAAYNYLMKQQEQAYNLDLWKLMNEYNSPSAQMMRYQDAGLNPNLIYNQQNTASSPQAASASTFRSAGTQSKSLSAQSSALNETVGSILSALRLGKDVYDYATYGAETNRWKMIGTQESALGEKLSNAWQDWLLHGENMIYGDASRLPNGPAAQQYMSRTQQINYGVARMQAVISLIGDQKLREQALTALDQYRLQMLEGQTGAALSINTGTSWLDSLLKALSFFFMNNGGRLLGTMW